MNPSLRQLPKKPRWRAPLPLATLPVMRRFGPMVCVLMCISFALLPFNTLHAHVSADHDDHTLLHGGHTHDSIVGEPPHETAEGEQVVQAHFAVADAGTSLGWVQWLTLIFALGSLLLFAPRVFFVPRPPGPDDRPVHSRGHWRPLLRGPPLTSI